MKQKMHFLNNWFKLFMSLSMVALLAVGCSDDDDDTLPVQEDSIVTLAAKTPDLSILASAIAIYPDLVSTLGAEGSFTVFAPTNAAFTALLGVIGQEELEDIPEDVLRRVLEYHVVAGTVALSTDLSDGQSIETVLGDNVTVSTSGGVSINGANVTAADISASNGVVHIVDAVLVPALELSIVNTVVEPAYFNKDFTTLTAAVVQAGLLETLTNPDAELTVFAPTNAAFEAAGITELPANDVLTPILQYHVLGSEVLAENLPATGSAITSLNGDFYLSINDNGVFINGTTEVIATDIDQDNGVVHVIDRTLVPASQNVVEIAVAASEATEGAEFGQLVAALTAVENDADAANLITALSAADGSFTVFAPTDAAFQALYDLVGDQDDDDDADITDLVLAAGGLETIATVLQYHVLGSRVFSTDIPNALGDDSSVTLTPLAGGDFVLNDDLTITDTDGALMLGSEDASIVNTDILGTNGVIHVIDQVILP